MTKTMDLYHTSDYKLVNNVTSFAVTPLLVSVTPGDKQYEYDGKSHGLVDYQIELLGDDSLSEETKEKLVEKLKKLEISSGLSERKTNVGDYEIGADRATVIDTETSENVTQNFKIASSTAVLSITPAPVYITGILGADKEYDGSDVAVLDFSQMQLDGVVASDLSKVSFDTSLITGKLAQTELGDDIPVTLFYKGNHSGILSLQNTGAEDIARNYKVYIANSQLNTTANVVEKKVVEEPGKEEPTKEVPSKDSPVAENPSKEESVVEGPGKTEPVVENPSKDEPVAEEPKNNQSSEIKVPEVKEPEIKEPEIKNPEVKTPEEENPEAEIPEVKAPEVKIPDTKIEKSSGEGKVVEAPALEKETIRQLETGDDSLFLTTIIGMMVGFTGTWFVVYRKRRNSKKDADKKADNNGEKES